MVAKPYYSTFIAANVYCPIFAQTHTEQPLPMPVAPEGSVPQFLGGSGCPEQIGEKIRSNKCCQWHATVRLCHHHMWTANFGAQQAVAWKLLIYSTE